MIERLSRPFRPVELGANARHVFQLRALGEDLRGAREYAASGIAAVTLARDDHLTLVLVALRSGEVMREHRAPSAGTALLLSGRAVFVAAGGEQRTLLEPGSLAAFSADLPHAVEAEEDALYLVTIGGRKRPAAAPEGDVPATRRRRGP